MIDIWDLLYWTINIIFFPFFPITSFASIDQWIILFNGNFKDYIDVWTTLILYFTPFHIAAMTCRVIHCDLEAGW